MLLNHVCVCVLSHVRLFVTPWTVACLAPLTMELSRQESWSVLAFPTPGDLPYPGIAPTSPDLGCGFFTLMPPGKLLGDWRILVQGI